VSGRHVGRAPAEEARDSTQGHGAAESGDEQHADDRDDEAHPPRLQATPDRVPNTDDPR